MERKSWEEWRWEYDQGIIAGWRIENADEVSCPTCQALTGRIYIPQNIPKLPVERCTHQKGCRCIYAPVPASGM